ncbi:aurkb-a [Symbiodinium pilosum]|uniref:Aurkb-a protein n=1 Tax=Symbiodinium pilosum TaxID=2952 RepID=A0A812QCB8_SYMPI|nr:aurkb-a [Symbiodinium pilosum]
MTDKYPQGFQSIVKMNCLDGQEFAGELRPDKSKAEEAAATQAMLVYKEEAKRLGLDRVGVAANKRKAVGPPIPVGPPGKKVKLEPGVIGMPGLVPQQSANIAPNNKMDLATHCARIARKIMEKSDIHFETHQVEGDDGFQAVLRLQCLPGVWGSRQFVGQVQRKKTEAEQSTAGVALAAIKNDPFLMSKFNEPPKQKNIPPRIGKGQGKGKAVTNALPVNVPPTAQAFSYPAHLQALAIPGIPQTGFWG